MCLGIPGQIVGITNHEKQLGMADVSGIQREVNLSCIAEDNVPLEQYIDEWVLVHVGFAMSIIDAAEAAVGHEGRAVAEAGPSGRSR